MVKFTNVEDLDCQDFWYGPTGGPRLAGRGFAQVLTVLLKQLYLIVKIVLGSIISIATIAVLISLKR